MRGHGHFRGFVRIQVQEAAMSRSHSTVDAEFRRADDTLRSPIGGRAGGRAVEAGVMRRVARWVGVVGVAVLALAAPGRAGAAPTSPGRVLYSNNSTTTQIRTYAAGSPGVFSAAAGTAAGVVPTFIVDRAAPTRNEHIAGYVSGTTLYVMRWNGTTWSNEWNIAVGGDAVNGRRFDIAYEEVTGDALVVYSTTTNGTVAWRTWNGAAWSTATNLAMTAALGSQIAWIKLLPRPGSDQIAMTMHDTGTTTANTADLATNIWSGTAWGTATNHSTAMTNTTGQLVQNDVFDQAWESTSGDLMVVWTQSTPQQYWRARTGTTWGTATSFGTARTLPLQMTLASDPNSNAIVLVWNRGGSTTVYGNVWSGTGWAVATASTISTGTTGATVAINKKFVAAQWLVAGGTSTAVAMWATSTGGQVGYNTATTAGAWGTAATQAFTGTGAFAWMDSSVDPRGQDTLMLTYSDANRAVWARQLVLTAGPTLTWTPDSSPALGTTLTATNGILTQNFDFTYDRYLGTPASAPTGVNVTGVGETALTVNWTDSASGTAPITYTVQQSPTGLAGSFVDVGTCVNLAAGTRTCAVSGLSGNTTYYYQVVATNVAGSAASTPAVSQLTLPAAPAQPTTSGVTYNNVTVAWASPGGTGTITNYKIYRSTDGTNFTLVQTTASATPTSWSDGTVQGSTQYWYKVSAVNGTGEGAQSVASAPVTTGAPPQTVTVGNGAGVTAAAIAPGAVAWTPVDSFDVTVTSGTPTGSLTGITYTAITGMSQYLAGVRFVRASDGFVLGTDAAPTGEAWSIAIAAGTDLLSASSKSYRVEVQPKTHAQIDAISPVPGATLTLAPGTMAQDAVTAISTSAGASVNYADGSTADPFFGAVVIDNLSPANVTGASANGGGLEATLSWTNPGDADFQKVVVCGKTSALAAADKPAEGADPAAGAACGTASVVHVGTASPAIVNLAASTTWYFRFFSRDVNGNFSSGVTVGPVIVENFQSDGDLTPWATTPVVSILNPKSGAVLTLPAKVQVRVFSPTAGGALVPADTVNLVVGGVNHVLGPTARNTKYVPSSATAGVWEYTIPSLAFGAGAAVELRANATNGGGGPVYSARVNVKISLAQGDGNLLVRDDSSQLCTDCHAGITTHSSEIAGNKHGSWVATCRDCHTAHQTTNLSLVNQQIKPLEVNGTTTAINVDFKSRTGYATSSFASPANNGPCQVCHTRTDYYRNTGLDGDGSVSGNATTGHNPSSPCTTCHLHTKGLGASCTSCHGTEGRGAVAGADSHHAAAPPAVAALAAVKVTTNNAHLAHVSEANLRATPFACVECHSTMKHQTTHDVDMGYGTVATGNGAVTALQMTPAAGALAAGYATTPTCTNYCHSDAKPLGNANAAFPATLPRWDAGNTGTVLGCTSCHGDGTAGLALSAKHAKHLSATTYNYTCDECHAGVVANDQRTLLVADRSLHVNGARNVGFSASYRVTSINNSFGGYSGAPGYSCSAIYCHSDGTSTTSFASADPSVTWNGGSVTCGSCHPTPMASGTHPSHVASATTGSYGCQTCHQTTTADGASIASYTLHVNGAKDVTGVTTWDGLGKTCSSNYCHSNGRRVAASRAYTTMTWASATDIGCNGCHGKTSPYGAPDYANTGADTADANGHQKHVGSAGDCTNCHNGFVTPAGTAIAGGSHTDTNINVAFNTGVTGNVTFAAGTATTSATCTNVTCHGGNSGTLVRWGGSMPAWTCSSCHGSTADRNDWDPSNGIASLINISGTPNEWTAYGHGNTATTFDEFTGATDRCLYCHDGSVAHRTTTNPFRLRGASTAAAGATGGYDAASASNGNEVCLNCHAASGANGVDPEGAAGGQPRVCQLTGLNPCDQRVDAWHQGSKHVAPNGNGGVRCWDCHDPHGDGTNLAMIGSDTLRNATDPYGLTGTRSTTPAVLTLQGAGGYTNTTTRNGICQVCHTATKYWRDTSEPTAHQAGTDCTLQCHKHEQPPNLAFKGLGDCILCHNAAVTGTVNRRAITPEMTTAGNWSHKRNGAYAVTKDDCIVCHMEGDATTREPGDLHGDTLIQLRDPDTGTTIEGVTFTAAGGTSPGSFSSNGAPMTFTTFSRNLAVRPEQDPAWSTLAAIQVNLCLHCHDANGAQSAAARVPTTGTAGKPFGTTIAAAQGTYTGASGNTACSGAVGSNPLADGCVVNVSASFATGNSSYHPILGKQNNWYARGAGPAPATTSRMSTPWDLARVSGTVSATEWGLLMTCWDCHALPADANTITKTVTAHGGAATVRGTVTVTGTPSTTNAVTLCVKCHAGYNTCTGSYHCAGSAFSTDVNQSPMPTYMQWGCNICHASGYNTAVPRPVRAQDSHGSNALGSVGTSLATLNRWSTDPRPYAFIRNRQIFQNHQPVKIGGASYTAMCNIGASPCNQSGNLNYSVGGTY
jgi:predicted CxxxxCH...CXXCH cytochrome family protein